MMSLFLWRRWVVFLITGDISIFAISVFVVVRGMLLARRVHARGHAGIPIARRQSPPDFSKSDRKDHGDPPGKQKNAETTPPPVQDPTPPTPANAEPSQALSPAGGGGYYSSTTSTTTTTQTRPPSTVTSSRVPSPTPNRGLTSTGTSTGTGYGSSSNGGVANAGSIPEADNESLSPHAIWGTSESQTSSPDPSPSNTAANASTLANGKTSPSGGVIAAVVIFMLLSALAIIVLILRRRSKARRQEQAIRWGTTRDRPSADDEYFSFRNSSRSSFATTFDHATFEHSTTANVPPPPPPMAEVGRPDGTAPTLILDTDADQQKRLSTGSAHSDNSQFLVVHHRESVNRASVTDCTESFPFPLPPLADTSSLHSGGSEGHRSTFPRNEEPEILYIASPLGALHPTPSPTTMKTVSRSTQPSLPPTLPNPFADNDPFGDPFEDPKPLPPPPPSGTFPQFQTIRRPFFPQLQDELQVVIGDSVRVAQIFDDGWAMVEKVSSSNTTTQCELGLIPLDCLRDHPVGGTHSLLGGQRLSSQQKA